MSNILTPILLTKEKFEPFGQVIELDQHNETKKINYGQTDRFHDLATLDLNQNNGRPIFNIFRSKPINLPFKVKVVERHPLSSQLFYPLTGSPFLVLVAPNVDKPNANDLQLFISNGRQGVNYAANTWHHYLLALNAVSDFVVIDRSGPEKNCQEHFFEQEIVIESI